MMMFAGLLMVVQLCASENKSELPPVTRFVTELTGKIEHRHEMRTYTGGHLNKILRRFFDVVLNQHAGKQILNVFADNLAFFQGGRKRISSDMQLAEHLAEDEIRMINRWQTWLPWVRPDMEAGLLAYASEKLQEGAEGMLIPDQYERDKNRFAIHGLYWYIVTIVLQDLFGQDANRADLEKNKSSLLYGAMIDGQKQDLLYQGPIEIPDAFLSSYEDYRDLLSFIYKGLNEVWDAGREHRKIPCELLDMLIYRSVLNVDQDAAACKKDVLQEMKKYLNDDLSRVGFSGPQKPMQDENGVAQECSIVLARCMEEIKELYEIRPIPSGNVKENRALWIRLVDWFSMAHRFSRASLRKKDWSQEEVWSVMRMLLSQRLLAGDDIIRPVAETLARCSDEVSFKIYQELLYSTGNTSKRWDDDYLQSDLEALSLCEIGASPDESELYSGLKNIFDLSLVHVQSLFVEAAIEEVMLACDGLVVDTNNTYKSRQCMAKGFNSYRRKNVASLNETSEVRRLHYALQMLSNAINYYGVDMFVQFDAPKGLLGVEQTANDWREQYREIVLTDIKQQVAEKMKLDYETIQKRTDQALAKILPHILKNFDVSKEFPQHKDKVAPRPKKKPVTGLPTFKSVARRNPLEKGVLRTRVLKK